ncbi:MAG TPA: hypothetical protein VK439_11895, partial [Rubrivivax sp.]|nr:hypothetical protein [Rubrivivax sp.]
MPSTFRIAFLGFTEFERSALGSYFRLANRDPNYAQVQMLTDADFLVADADHVPSMQLVAATDRMAETVFIGGQAPPGAVAWMTRPIDALHVMRELDAMVTLRHARDGDAAGDVVKPTGPQPSGGRLPSASPMQVTATTATPTPSASASELPVDRPPLHLHQEGVGQTGSGADATTRGDWNSASLPSSGIATPFQPWEPSESLLERSASQPLAPPPMSPRMAAAKAAAAVAARR